MKNMLKVVIACCLLMVVTPSLVEAKNKGYKNSNRYGNAEESKIKAGIETEGLLLYQAFGEYKFYENLGVRVAIAYDVLHVYVLEKLTVPRYNGENVFLILRSINVPITLRLYSGEDRQFCLFGGIHLGYITDAQVLRLSNLKQFDVFEIIKKDDILADIDKIPDHVTKLRFAMILGFDYETSFGLTFGICFKKDFLTIMEANNSFFNCNLRPTLGYNFAKLFA